MITGRQCTRGKTATGIQQVPERDTAESHAETAEEFPAIPGIDRRSAKAQRSFHRVR
jgi:hypothetical protein